MGVCRSCDPGKEVEAPGNRLTVTWRRLDQSPRLVQSKKRSESFYPAWTARRRLMNVAVGRIANSATRIAPKIMG